MKLVSFIFYNLSNVTLIILLPLDITNEFLNFYSVGSGIFSFIVFYNFSKKIFINIFPLVLLSIPLIFVSFIFINLPILIFFYVFLLLFSDYYFSQSNLIFSNLTFKVFLLISSLFLCLNFSIYQVLQLKVIIVIFYLLFSRIFKITIKELKIKSPIIYSAYTCLIYSSALFLVSILAEKEIVKFFYILIQIFLGLKLKLFDLKIREINYEFINIDRIFNYLSIFLFLILSIYFKEFLFFVIYFVSNMSLEYVKKKYIL